MTPLAYAPLDQEHGEEHGREHIRDSGKQNQIRLKQFEDGKIKAPCLGGLRRDRALELFIHRDPEFIKACVDQIAAVGPTASWERLQALRQAFLGIRV